MAGFILRRAEFGKHLNHILLIIIYLKFTPYGICISLNRLSTFSCSAWHCTLFSHLRISLFPLWIPWRKDLCVICLCTLHRIWLKVLYIVGSWIGLLAAGLPFHSGPGLVCPTYLLEWEWGEVLFLIRGKGGEFHVRPRQKGTKTSHTKAKNHRRYWNVFFSWEWHLGVVERGCVLASAAAVPTLLLTSW